MRTLFEGRVPKCGDSIIFCPGTGDRQARNNGAEFVPAIITQAHGMDPGSCINLRVFPDDSGMLWRTSQSHAMDTAWFELNNPMTREYKFKTNLNEHNDCWIYKEEYDEGWSLYNQWLKDNPGKISPGGIAYFINQVFHSQWLPFADSARNKLKEVDEVPGAES